MTGFIAILALLWYSLYCSGLEPNLQHLWDMLVYIFSLKWWESVRVYFHMSNPEFSMVLISITQLSIYKNKWGNFKKSNLDLNVLKSKPFQFSRAFWFSPMVYHKGASEDQIQEYIYKRSLTEKKLQLFLNFLKRWFISPRVCLLCKTQIHWTLELAKY